MKEEREHRKLDVWKKSLEFAKDIYEITKKYPQSEIYGLVNQIGRPNKKGCSIYSQQYSRRNSVRAVSDRIRKR